MRMCPAPFSADLLFESAHGRVGRGSSPIRDMEGDYSAEGLGPSLSNLNRPLSLSPDLAADRAAEICASELTVRDVSTSLRFARHDKNTQSVN